MPIFKKKGDERPKRNSARIWARPEMTVTFRAQIMPGRSNEERTYRIKEVKNNGRVILHDFPGEHSEGTFEPIRFRPQRNDQKS